MKTIMIIWIILFVKLDSNHNETIDDDDLNRNDALGENDDNNTISKKEDRDKIIQIVRFKLDLQVQENFHNIPSSISSCKNLTH